MAAQPHAYRAFTDEFILHMDRRGGFPRDKAIKKIKKWFESKKIAVKAEYLSDVKH